MVIDFILSDKVVMLEREEGYKAEWKEDIDKWLKDNLVFTIDTEVLGEHVQKAVTHSVDYFWGNYSKSDKLIFFNDYLKQKK